MATVTPAGAAPEPALIDTHNRDEWFTTTPDPWHEIALLEHGGDRTFAMTVNRIVVNAEPAQRPEIEKKLLAVLERPELTDAGRLFVCRMLVLIGSAACVPAVAPLLADSRTADVARLALDANPDPGVDNVYRAALGKLSGAPKAGLIRSMAWRGDKPAREALAAIAKNETESAEVRAAADAAVKSLTEGAR